MALGTGIFLSSIVVSLVLLFLATKDRWNWKKGIKRIAIGLIIVICLCAATYFAWDPVQAFLDRPKPFQEMAGIKLGASQADVKFLKGTPEITCTDSDQKGWSRWVWAVNPHAEKIPTRLVVSFQEPYGVWTVQLIPGDIILLAAPALDHVSVFQTFESIDSRFGPASTITPSDDGLTRAYSYRRYNLRVIVGGGHVREYGIYHPKHPDYIPWATGSKRLCIDEDGIWIPPSKLTGPAG
jgi:hypothetical protein